MATKDGPAEGTTSASHRYDWPATYLAPITAAVGGERLARGFADSPGMPVHTGQSDDRGARPFVLAAEEAATLALPRGGATLGQEALEHIVFRHWSTSGAANAGKFASGTTARSLRDMIDTTVRQGALRPNTAGRPGTIFEHDFGGQIGTNIAGNATSRLRVVVRPNGNVITAFPY